MATSPAEAAREPATSTTSPTSARLAHSPVRPKPARLAGAERTFKACRTCRRQKMRCEGRPCTRCVASGVECLFDRIKSGAARETAVPGNLKRKRLEELESELLQLRRTMGPEPPVGARTNTRDAAVSGEQVSNRNRPRSSSGRPATATATASSVAASAEQTLSPSRVATPANPVNEDDSTSPPPLPPPDPYGLTPNDLRAPVTAMHVLSPDSTERQQQQEQQQHHLHLHEPSQSSFFASVSSTASAPLLHPADFIAAGLVDEAQARGLFNVFMTGSNCFLPVFDPALDTFDSLRVRSPFCLSVILAAAARAEDATFAPDSISEICHKEARRLAAETLFIGMPQLEDVQAMAIFAAFSERTWLAIGHATQMALVLGLERSVPQLLERIKSHDLRRRKQDRLLVARARTWLTVLHIELEIAAGTARQPRLEQIDPANLRLLSTYPFLRPSDARILAIVDAVELRGRLQKEIEESTDLLENPMATVRLIIGQFHTWWAFWDQCLEEQGYPQASFQRIGLGLQKDYATILACCAALGRIQQLASEQLSPHHENQSADSAADEVLAYASNFVVDMLSFLLRSPAYRWNLKWAPTYSVLIIAFSTAFALKVSASKPDLVDRSRLYSLAEEVAKILQTHPHKSFYCLIQLLLALPYDVSNFQEGGALPEALNNFGGSFALQPLDRAKASSLNKALGGLGAQMQPQGLASFQGPNMYVPDEILSTPSGQEGGGDDVAVASAPYDPQQQQYKVGQRLWGNLERNWIFDNSSIGSFGLPDQGNASVFDFDLPLIMDSDSYLQQPNQ